jgi:hypothetical protein
MCEIPTQLQSGIRNGSADEASGAEFESYPGDGGIQRDADSRSKYEHTLGPVHDTDEVLSARPSDLKDTPSNGLVSPAAGLDDAPGLINSAGTLFTAEASKVFPAGYPCYITSQSHGLMLNNQVQHGHESASSHELNDTPSKCDVCSHSLSRKHDLEFHKSFQCTGRPGSDNILNGSVDCVSSTSGSPRTTADLWESTHNVHEQTLSATSMNTLAVNISSITNSTSADVVLPTSGYVGLPYVRRRDQSPLPNLAVELTGPDPLINLPTEPPDHESSVSSTHSNQEFPDNYWTYDDEAKWYFHIDEEDDGTKTKIWYPTQFA